MAADRQLSRDFYLHEAPCFWRASEEDVLRLQETAARVLQPIRNRFGRTEITSWMWWSDCTPRTRSHAQGGTVDFTVPGHTREAWEWGNTHLMPSGYIGRWIYEPEHWSEGRRVQGEHIHMAPRQDMLAYNGDGRIQSLEEREDGTYRLAFEWTEGTYTDPYEIPGFEVVAAGVPWWASAGLLLALFGFDMSSQAAGGWTLKHVR